MPDKNDRTSRDKNEIGGYKLPCSGQIEGRETCFEEFPRRERSRKKRDRWPSLLLFEAVDTLAK